MSPQLRVLKGEEGWGRGGGGGGGGRDADSSNTFKQQLRENLNGGWIKLALSGT